MAHSRKYEPNPYRKEDCHCIPEPMFAKDEQKKLEPLTTISRFVKIHPYCLRCGLPITRQTIVRVIEWKLQGSVR